MWFIYVVLWLVKSNGISNKGPTGNLYSTNENSTAVKTLDDIEKEWDNAGRTTASDGSKLPWAHFGSGGIQGGYLFVSW